MNTIAFIAGERLFTKRPTAERSAETLSCLKAALKTTAVIGAFFIVALSVVTFRVLATAYMVPSFQDALARVLPFLG